MEGGGTFGGMGSVENVREWRFGCRYGQRWMGRRVANYPVRLVGESGCVVLHGWDQARRREGKVCSVVT